MSVEKILEKVDAIETAQLAKIEEVKTHKRSQYRNRFNKLDEVESKIIKNINCFKQ